MVTGGRWEKETHRDVPGCAGMCRDAPGCAGICRDVPGCAGMRRDLQGCAGMRRDVPGCPRPSDPQKKSWMAKSTQFSKTAGKNIVDSFFVSRGPFSFSGGASWRASKTLDGTSGCKWLKPFGKCITTIVLNTTMSKIA